MTFFGESCWVAKQGGLQKVRTIKRKANIPTNGYLFEAISKVFFAPISLLMQLFELSEDCIISHRVTIHKEYSIYTLEIIIQWGI